MRTWRFGIIGCGGIGAFHQRAIQEIENARLACVSSRDARRAVTLAQASGSDWTTDYHELLGRSDIDVVCVTTSSGSHFAIGREVLRAGKHLIVEKPITIESREAQALVNLAREKGVSVGVISQRRFEPAMKLLKQCIQHGRLGRLLLVEAGTPWYRSQAYYDSADWRGTISEDGGALMNQGIHQIDLLLWLGGEVESVFGKTATVTHRMEAEDMGLAIVKFKQGAFGTVMSSTSIRPGFLPFIHCFGEKGSVKILGQSIVEWAVDGENPPTDVEAVKSDGSSDPLAAASPIYHKLQLEDFLEALEQGRNPAVTGEDGKRAVELVQGIVASSASGREIFL